MMANCADFCKNINMNNSPQSIMPNKAMNCAELGKEMCNDEASKKNKIIQNKILIPF